MECYICSEYTYNHGHLCKKHCEDLFKMLNNKDGLIIYPEFKHHCHICEEFENRKIIQYQEWALFCDCCIFEAAKKLGLNRDEVPQIKDILNKLNGVLEGTTTREEVSDFIRPFVIDDSYRIEDHKLWSLMNLALGIDLKDSPTSYFHTEDEIGEWIDRFE